MSDRIFVGGGLKTDACCERCVFGRGEHAEECDSRRGAVLDLHDCVLILTPKGLRTRTTGAPAATEYIKA